MHPGIALAIGVGPLLRDHPIAALGALFIAGISTSLTPCIYPMIPITVGIIGGGAAGRGRRRTAGLTLTYAAGLALLYAVLGLIAGLSGSLFGAVSSSPWARLIVGNLLLIFGLAMLGTIPVNAPARLLTWAGGLSGGSYPAVFLLGATSGIVAAPCGAPAFAAVLTWVAATRSGVLGFVYLFVFALGMTAILIAAGLFSGSLGALPRSGRWLEWIKRGAGAVLLIMAEYYFVLAGQVW
ncbi:MAG TPA: cytochrome c biogenesis protein CcdA [Gemmatimonadales bacterium]|nr:cytochrome c biogenesis protein CcdA [Gemmatimonadales bacterium]